MVHPSNIFLRGLYEGNRLWQGFVGNPQRALCLRCLCSYRYTLVILARIRSYIRLRQGAIRNLQCESCPRMGIFELTDHGVHEWYFGRNSSRIYVQAFLCIFDFGRVSLGTRNANVVIVHTAAIYVIGSSFAYTTHWRRVLRPHDRDAVLLSASSAGFDTPPP